MEDNKDEINESRRCDAGQNFTVQSISREECKLVRL